MYSNTRRLTPDTARHLASVVRKLEPVGVTVPRRILEATSLAEDALPVIKQQRDEVVGMVGQTGPGFTTTIADGDLTGEQILARLVGADIDAARVHNTFDGAQVAVGATLHAALKAHGEKWIPILRPIIEDRADAVYSGVYDPDSIDYKRDPRGAEYALRDDATALAWGELNTLWEVVQVFIGYGIIPGNAQRPDAHLFSTSTSVRHERDHLDFTRFIVMCREEHEPSLYTQSELIAFEASEAAPLPLPRDAYAVATGSHRY